MNNLLIFSTVSSTRMVFSIHAIPKKCCVLVLLKTKQAKCQSQLMGVPWWGMEETDMNRVKVALWWLSRAVVCLRSCWRSWPAAELCRRTGGAETDIWSEHTGSQSYRQTDRQAGIDVGLTGCCTCCCRRSWWTRWRKRRPGGSSWTAGWLQVSRAFVLHILVVSAAAAASSYNLLSTEGATVPPRSLEVAALACRCLDRMRKRRPTMTEVRHCSHLNCFNCLEK